MFNFFSASAEPHREHSSRPLSQPWQLRCDVTGNHSNWGMTNSITHTHIKRITEARLALDY